MNEEDAKSGDANRLINTHTHTNIIFSFNQDYNREMTQPNVHVLS